MVAYITPRRLCGCFSAPPSKSETHRALICAALGKEKSIIYNPALCDDTLATAGCLEALGASIEYGSGAACVTPIKEPSLNAELNCGESASTLRFLLPVAAALGANARFVCGSGLISRPVLPMLDCLRGCGIEADARGNEIAVSGRLKPVCCEIDSSLSSQFLSGLLFACIAAGEGSKVALKGSLASPGYAEMTLAVLRKYGADFIKADNCFEFSGLAEKPGGFTVGGDWSGAAALLCAGAAGGEITCGGLDVNSYQPDKEILNILPLFGAKLSIYNNSIKVSGESLHGAQLNAADFPDLVPSLCALAAVSQGETVIRGVSRLKYKETDRAASVSRALGAIGADIKPCEDNIVINGKGELAGGKTNSFGDHRVAMAVAAASCRCRGEVVIEDFGAVSKSYPAFAGDFAALGGVINVV